LLCLNLRARDSSLHWNNCHYWHASASALNFYVHYSNMFVSSCNSHVWLSTIIFKRLFKFFSVDKTFFCISISYHFNFLESKPISVFKVFYFGLRFISCVFCCIRRSSAFNSFFVSHFLPLR
jgi:hypothetical protein